MAPTELQSLLFFAEKAIFRYPAFECCGETIIFHLGSQKKFGVHNLNTYTYPQKKYFTLARLERWQFQFEVWSDFPPVYILSDFKVFNALTFLMDYFFYGL